MHSGVRLHIEQTPECALLRVVRASRIACGRPDPAIFLLDEIRVAQTFITAVTPFASHPLVQAFGESFRQAIGEGLGHDRVVVVVLGPEPVAQFLQTDPAGYCERTDVIGQAGFLWAR